ncbi:MAG: DUF1097 family protein [Propionibacteriaceae bacterium]|jgi:hypothetical protein|nr:DUF1097 family protein [Propionibacteriaceae bacterium]
MTFMQNLIAYAIPIAVLAALVQVIDQVFVGKLKGIGPFKAGGGWVAFQAWALYFLAAAFNPTGVGKDGINGSLWTLISYSLGIVAAILIFEFAGVLGKTGFWATPLALLVLCIPVIFLQLTSAPFNYVPALFCGAGVFFCIMSYFGNTPGAFKEGASKGSKYASAALGELVYCAIGLAAGFGTVTWANYYFANLA